jgi:hypothetical protein
MPRLSQQQLLYLTIWLRRGDEMASGKTNVGGGLAQVDFVNYVGEKGLVTFHSPGVTPITLGSSRTSPAGASFTAANYALFLGGASSAFVDAFNPSLVRTTPTALSVTTLRYPAVSYVGNYLLVGMPREGASNVATINAYNTSLTRTTPTGLSYTGRNGNASFTASYALFAGGWNGTSYFNTVNAYDSNLTRTTPTSLSVARRLLGVTEVGVYALFGGGNTGSVSSAVDAYNNSLVRSSPTALNIARDSIGGTKTNSFGLFVGGSLSSASVDAYSSNLTRTNPPSFRKGLSSSFSGVNYEGLAITANTNTDVDIIQYYTDSALSFTSKGPEVRYTPTGRGNVAVKVGTNLLIGAPSGDTALVLARFKDYETTVPLAVTKDSVYNFSGVEVEATVSTILSQATPINGYIKYKRGAIQL